MRIAITGGTGFVGRHLARSLTDGGHEVVLIARGRDRRDESVRALTGARFIPAETDDTDRLADAFHGCDSVVHCAGINRQIGDQTYERVHVHGTRSVVEAARRAGVGKIVMLSFLRARPDCGSGYHESKWAAEELVRHSGIPFTILKAGVIYGKGDHMLDHLSHAFHTFPLFALVSFRDRLVRPLAVEDLLRVLEASLTQTTLNGMTVPVLGPETLTLTAAVKRVAEATGKRVFFFPAPVAFHYVLAWLLEKVMQIPLVSLAQVRILSEGITEPPSPLDELPRELSPTTPFTLNQIRSGLPAPGGFRLKDLRSCLTHP
ncbi:MAG TPA: NAD(P)H-binding protein [Thermoanaerobaculia bacterium]